MQKIFSKNQVPDIVREVLKTLRAKKGESATVVALSGDLGAGKTTLTQAIARELGIRETVISPTFVIMKIYELEKEAWKHLVHIDAYRLESSRELERLGWAEIIADPENLVLIEWPEKVPEAIPETAYRISLEHSSEEERTISL